MHEQQPPPPAPMQQPPPPPTQQQAAAAQAQAAPPSPRSSSQQQRRPRPEDAARHITVSDPVQHSEGMNKYTSYRVDVRGDVGGGGGSGASPPSDQASSRGTTGGASNANYFQSPNHTAVLRRYSDFLWLYERLGRERPGAILSPLPEKQAVARFTAAFVEDRRANLETFLRRVAVHPELSDANCLRVFLRADDATFHVAKNAKSSSDPNEGQQQYGGGGFDDDMSALTNATGPSAFGAPPGASPTRKKKEGIKQWFAETKTTALISVGLSDNLVHSPDDDLFVEIETYVNNLDAQMKHVLAQSSALVRKGKEIANGMFEFGLAFSLLGQSEDGQGGGPPGAAAAVGSDGSTSSPDSLGTALGKMGAAADALSVLSAELAEGEENRFEAPLKDYIRTIHAVKSALAKRADRRLTYTTALSEVNARAAAAERLRGVPGREDKAYAANRSLQRAQEAADAAREDFAAVSQRILREVDRFKREKAEEVRCTVMDYINLQVEYNERMEEVWGRLIPQLERIRLAGEGGGGGGNDGGGGGGDGAGGGGQVDSSGGTVDVGSG